MRWFLAWFFFASAAHGDPSLELPFDLQDLEKLQGREKWAEVVLRAKSVPVADQGTTWKNVVARSSERYLRQLHGEGSLDGLEMAIRLPAEFPFLYAEKQFMAARREVAVEGIARCFENPFTPDRCTERAVQLIQGDKSSDRFLEDLLVVMEKAGQFDAIARVVREVLTPATAPRLCSRLDFKKGLKSLWDSTDWEVRLEASKMARGYCFSVLKGWIEEKAKDPGTVGTEACGVLRKKVERLPAACKPSKGESGP